MSTQTLKSNQGQQGSPLKLAFEELSENEQQLVTFLGVEGRPTFTIKGLMEGLGWHLGRTGKARGNSKVRNTLRRLVRANWVGHKSEIGDGEYRITLRGFNQLVKLATEVANDEKPKKHKPAKTEPEVAAPPPAAETTSSASADEF